MNYRHAFHAGNHCDVLKHAALAIVLARLALKEKPFSVIDTHAGRGLYDLDGSEAGRSGEHRGGVARLIDDPAAPASLRPYLDCVRRQNPFGGLRWYPGSPVMIKDMLRKGDSAKFCELQPEERLALQTTVGAHGAIRVYDRDGYEAVRAFLPPVERRGLVLIDPPFEKPGEFDRLSEAVEDGVKRWASGVFMIWRPIKDEDGYARFLEAVRHLSLEKTLIAELSVAPRMAGKLTGSGLYVINPPFGLADAFAELLPYLAARLATASGGGWRLEEIEKGAAIRDLAGEA
ncbi:MAG: 23S rRNA (adenine(2030)-N(6))-methyltransferase RlmJ [Parvularculaceae bacterium]|nr:23S rRNA (adenine(2030)-N(6))-methyltransferase RlmJ [Parvularculaceae bacterium]